LAGGVGGAKLAYGLQQILPPENLTIIVNTGDDFWHYGLRICPDLDTVMYTLAGMVDRRQGWGIANDTTITLSALDRLGEAVWFRLGDQDLATHMMRTQLWHEGYNLTEITQRLTSVLGLKCRIVPMTDQPVATMIDTIERGELAFQMYFVKHRWQPTFKSLRLDGIENAQITPQIREAVTNADAIIVGPSNPWLSITPIISVPEFRALLTAQNVPRIAITPIIQNKAVKGPTAKIMQELEYEVSARAVRDYYGDLINGFIYDEQDGTTQIDDIKTVALDTYMNNDYKRIQLARNVLRWLDKDWI